MTDARLLSQNPLVPCPCRRGSAERGSIGIALLRKEFVDREVTVNSQIKPALRPARKRLEPREDLVPFEDEIAYFSDRQKLTDLGFEALRACGHRRRCAKSESEKENTHLAPPRLVAILAGRRSFGKAT